MTLAPADLELVEAIAQRVVELLDGRDSRLTELVDAPMLARLMKTNTHTIYRHARDLGAVKIGQRLRFDPRIALERAALPDRSAGPVKAPPRQRRRVRDSDAPPLSIRP